MIKSKKRGNLIIISGTTCAGKGTVIKHLLERAMEFIHMLQTDYSNYHTIFVVTHVGVIQAIDYFLKHGKETSVPLLSVDNAGYLKYQL